MSNVWIHFNELDNRNIRYIDVRFSLTDSQEGRRLYKESHMSGAIFMDLENDLSNMDSKDGRHPMPSKDKLQLFFEKHGLQYSDTIVI